MHLNTKFVVLQVEWYDMVYVVVLINYTVDNYSTNGVPVKSANTYLLPQI